MDTLDILAGVLKFLIDLFTFALILGVFWTIGTAVLTMARNRSPRWDTIFATLVVLIIGLILVQVYPPQVVKSVRRGLEDARPEAALLRDELANWMPRWNPGQSTAVFSTAVPTVTPIPAATNTPAPIISIEAQPTAVAPTSTPLPPTATIVPTLDLTQWNPQTPPPTPVGGGK